ncbi:MAG: MMPL family transporter [Aestuariivita sp.]|nr:MMPL family transporter [Aestuariivita sp.]
MVSETESGFFDRFYALIVSRYLVTMIFSVLLIAVFAAGIPNLTTVNVGIRNHFNDNDPHLVKLEQFEEIYALSDSVLVVVEPPGDTLFTRDSLVVVEQLTEALWQTPFSVRIDSITNHLHSRGDENGIIVQPLISAEALLDQSSLEQIKEIALTFEEISGRFVSRDGRLAGLIVSLELPIEGREETKVEVVDALYNLINVQRAAHPQINYYIYGELPLNDAVRTALEEDMSLLAPIAFATMVLVAFILLRSVWGVVGILVMLMAVMVSSFGFAGWAGLKFYAESGATVFVLMAIAVAHSVHLIQSVRNGMREGLEKRVAIVHAMQINVRPIFLTSLTTAIGFLSLNFSEMPAFQVMGNIVAFGAMNAFFFSITLLPAFLAITPMRVPVTQYNGKNGLFEYLAKFVISNHNSLLGAFAILSVVSAVGISRIELNDTNIDLLDNSSEVRQSADFIAENFAGLDTFEYSLNSGRTGGITDKEYLQKVDSFAEWLRNQPEVSHVTSVADIMKRLNQNLHGDVPGSYVLPENSELAAQYLVLYEFSLPIGRDMNNLINFERSASRMTVAVTKMSVREQIEFDERAQVWLRENAPAMASGATGVTIVGAYSVMRNIVRMLMGTFIAMSIVSLLLIFVFKSVRMGLLSLVPNFLPAIMAMGAWGYAFGTVTIAASIVTAVAFGIVVDDTIHLLSKYQKSRAEGKTPDEAILPTFKLVGRPLLTTTLIFALGFFVFGVSGLATNQTLGVLVGCTVVIALIADFLLFPPLLMKFDKKSGR